MIEIKSRYNLYGVMDTHIGGRPENQDDMGWIDTPLGCLVLVFDGMGGGPGGKTASRIGKEVFVDFLNSNSAKSDKCEVLRQATAAANNALLAEMDKNPELRGMGSTYVAALISEDALYVSHCGDARFYKLRGGNMLMRSQDHSLVGELARRGVITEEQARTSPQSNVVTCTLGCAGKTAQPDVDVLAFEDGDRFVLCTDGVWNSMPHSELIKQFTTDAPLKKLAMSIQQLVEQIAANEKRGHHDNHTIAIIDVKFNSKRKETMGRRHKIMFFIILVLLFISIIVNIISLVWGHKSEDNVQIVTEYVKEDPKAIVDRLYRLEAEAEFFKQQSIEAQNQLDSIQAKNTEVMVSDMKSDMRITNIINNISSLKQEYENYGEAVSMRWKSWRTIDRDIVKLDKQTENKYSSLVDSLKQCMIARDTLIVKVDVKNSRNMFGSTMSASRQIENARTLAERLRNTMQNTEE